MNKLRKVTVVVVTVLATFMLATSPVAASSQYTTAQPNVYYQKISVDNLYSWFSPSDKWSFQFWKFYNWYAGEQVPSEEKIIETPQQKPTVDEPTAEDNSAQEQPAEQSPTMEDDSSEQSTNIEDNQTAEQTAIEVNAYEQEVVDLTNIERQKQGLAPLELSVELSKVAREKSQDMVNNSYFSHQSPTYGSPFDMMNDFGISYRTAGENIAMGQRTPEQVVSGWMNSEGHRANIFNGNFTHIGVGYVEGNGSTYWTQMFFGK